MSTKAAVFGSLIARKLYSDLDRVFFRALKQSVVLCALACIAVLLGDLWLRDRFPAWSGRVVDPIPLAMLLCIPLVNQIISAQAMYLRAHKQEKFMVNSIVGAVLTGGSTFFLGRSYGILGMTCGYVLISILFGLTAATLTFLKYRKAWHQ
jgi:O-antigen/teichoic acid export membrane protein